MPAGLLWLFRTMGVAIVAFGAWFSGGQVLTCEGSPTAECRLQTRRWLGASVADDSSYRGITRVETIRERQTGQDADDAWYVGLFAGEHEAGRVFAGREQVQAALGQLTAWIEAGARGETRVSWSSWSSGLGVIAFGVAWLISLSLISRARR